MAVNPMQRKANNSFLLGILITLLITGVIIAILLLQLAKLNKQIKANETNKVKGYMVVSDIKSGTEIQTSQLKEVDINSAVKSSNIYATAPTGLKAKVDLHAGTVLTSDLTYEDTELAADVRKVEYNIITLPSQIQNEDYIDVRLTLPNGQDYIVVSHKSVEIPTINGVDSESCVWMQLSEAEILTMSNAIVEAYRMEGAKLYATRYVEGGSQTAATVTYLPSDEVIALMNKDPNIVQEAKNAIFARTRTDEKSTIRNPINNAKNNENAEDNLKDRVKSEIQGLQEERQKYLESLGME